MAGGRLNMGRAYAYSAKARIAKLFGDKVAKKYPNIFIGADRELQLKPNVVAYVVSQLQRFSLLASPVDVKGVAYYPIRNRGRNRGPGGYPG